MAAAVLVRILHHCTVVNIKGETYRIKDRKRNSLPTMKKEGEK
jgi:DNA replication protein DnaC